MKSILDLSYPIYFESHALDSLKAYVFKHVQEKPLFVITDDVVYPLHYHTLEKTLHTIKDVVIIPNGESSKSFEVYQKTIQELLEKGIKKGDVIVAFGGGVVGDLAGFVAATIFRGVELIQLPTTLLAQVDSSVGSKVGINSSYGKNLIGAFKDPALVYVYAKFLDTLPAREYRNGIAEIIKAGYIKDFSIIEDLNHDKSMFDILYKAIKVKVDIVLKDPFETYERKILNFGHTLGHAIEKDFNYESIKHGEAISHGMMYALKLGVKLGITDEKQVHDLKVLLSKYHLLDQTIKPYAHYIQHTLFDKKRVGEGIDFICLSKDMRIHIKHILFGDLYVD